MKKALALILALVLVLALCACGGSTAAPAQTGTNEPAKTDTPAASGGAATQQPASSGTTEPAKTDTPAASGGEAPAAVSDWSYNIVWSDGGNKKGTGPAAAQPLIDYVTEKTNGKVTFEVHWESELMGPPPEMEAVGKGEIDMAGVHHAFAGQKSPLIEFLSCVGARGVFEDQEHYWRFVDTPEVRQIIEDEMAKTFNVKLLYLCPASNSCVASTKPIHTFEDYKGLQIRTPGTASGVAYGLLGATPVSMSASEIYMALERGVIDAADTGTDEVLNRAFYEVTPYIVKDYTTAQPHALVSINLDLWNSMPEDIQQIFLEGAKLAEAAARQALLDQDKEILEQLEPLVEEIYLFPKEEVAKAVEILRPNTIETFETNVGDKALTDLILGYVESTRNG